MGVRSVLAVEVQDAKFVEFSAKFAKYQEALKKTPNVWAQVGKEGGSVAEQFERMTAALLAQNALAADTKDADNKRFTQLTSSERLWTSMAKSSAAMSKNILDIGTGVLKWGSLLGGGLLGGGLFGIDRMAGSVSNSRRSAMGLGMSIGEQKAFGVNFDRLVDPNFLSQVADMKMDPSKSAPLYAMGVGTGGSTEDTAVALLKAMRAKALATPVNQLGLLDVQTGMNVGAERWRTFHDMKSSEFDSLLAGNRRDISTFNIDAATALKWTNFTTQMERAGQSIFKTFVTGLAPLATPLTNLSFAFSKFLTTLLSGNGPVKEGIDNVAHWLTNFSGQLSRPEFLKSVETFTSDVGQLADAVHSVTNAVNHPGQALMGAVKADLTTHQVDRFNAAKSLVTGGWSWLMKEAGMARLASLDHKYGLPEGTGAYLWGHESSYGRNSTDHPGKNGAQGPFQIKPTAGGGVDLHNFDAASDRAEWIVAQELKRYHGDITRAIAAYHLGDGSLDDTVGKYKTDWRRHVPYVSELGKVQNGRTLITVQNNTGGSTHVTVAALAAGP